MPFRNVPKNGEGIGRSWMGKEGGEVRQGKRDRRGQGMEELAAAVTEGSERGGTGHEEMGERLKGSEKIRLKEERQSG
ncbi:hypothetical protein E2C01_051405 [Portunus trituberculatus]|uniref:Uncharacterized protein n=1 Tax=Portunus trituberculatus TaxID=210409 RepID=A0A5B7GIM3_PORTR|nr:hypothetical protein [Portunus trituberculatus]